MCEYRTRNRRTNTQKENTEKMEKRKRSKSVKLQQFGSVTVFVGKEEKEVQNLNLRTSVNEVIQAVLKDDTLIKSLHDEKDDSESGKGTSSESEHKTKSENWVLVESWRGIERPLPPRTRLLKVWNAWKLEQKYVRFHLRRAATTSFRHVPASSKALRSSRSRPRKSHMRKTRPNFVGATETFIDGPLSFVDLGGEMPGVNVPNLAQSDDDDYDDQVGDSALVATSATSGSTSGSTSVTFSSDLSVPTSVTTTTSSEDLDNVDEVRRIISICVEQQTHLKTLGERSLLLDKELDRLIQLEEENVLRAQIDQVLEQIEAIEERISAVNNAKNGFENEYQAQIEKIGEQNRQKKNTADYEKTRRLQTEIEAQLYLNLQLARKSDQLSSELNDLVESFESRQRLLDSQLKIETSHQTTTEQVPTQASPIVSEDSNSEVCTSPQCLSCPDCIELDKKTTGQSNSGDSDSAVSSMSSADFNRLGGSCTPLKASLQGDKYVRETLV